MFIAVAVFRRTLDTARGLFHVRTRTRKTSDAFRNGYGLVPMMFTLTDQ